MPLLKEMIFNMRRAIYTLAALLSSKTLKKQQYLLLNNHNPFHPEMKIKYSSGCASHIFAYGLYRVLLLLLNVDYSALWTTLLVSSNTIFTGSALTDFAIASV